MRGKGGGACRSIGIWVCCWLGMLTALLSTQVAARSVSVDPLEDYAVLMEAERELMFTELARRGVSGPFHQLRLVRRRMIEMGVDPAARLVHMEFFGRGHSIGNGMCEARQPSFELFGCRESCRLSRF